MFSAGVRAVEEQHVGAILALNHVATVARVPLEDIVAGAHQRHIVTLLAVDEVFAVTTE